MTFLFIEWRVSFEATFLNFGIVEIKLLSQKCLAMCNPQIFKKIDACKDDEGFNRFRIKCQLFAFKFWFQINNTDFQFWRNNIKVFEKRSLNFSDSLHEKETKGLTDSRSCKGKETNNQGDYWQWRRSTPSSTGLLFSLPLLFS